MEFVEHPFDPLYDSESRVLILGSFPSVKSREQNFFYGHPRNRFWKVISAVCRDEEPQNIKEKRDFILRNHLALWDVIASCEITGSSDSSIKNVKANDLAEIIRNSKITAVFVNGRAAEKYYNIYTRDKLGMSAICLPSTSPANAAWSLQQLVDEWNVVYEKLHNPLL